MSSRSEVGGAGSSFDLPFAHPTLFDLKASVRVDEALRYLKYRGQVLDEGLSAQLAAAKEMCEALSPKGVVRSLWVEDVSIERAQAVAEGEASELVERTGEVRLKQCDLTLPGFGIAHFLQDAPAVALVAVTLGAESERLLKREQALSPVSGLLVDACASSLVEAATDELQAQVNAAVSFCGLTADKRFSPGYGDLPLRVQHAFVQVVDGSKLLGLSVTESDMLIPTKSVTAVVRLTREERE